jgi:hypothetical protein
LLILENGMLKMPTSGKHLMTIGITTALSDQ